MDLSIVILAAGQGTRMKSKLPKVLHQLAGQPLLTHVCNTARSLSPDQIIVVAGHGVEVVQRSIAQSDIIWVTQQQQRGTGHAVQQALPHLKSDNRVLVLYGDVPLIRAATLEELTKVANQNTLSLLTMKLEDPTGYGRVLRDEANEVQRIVEEKDASREDRQICEVNTGILSATTNQLMQLLPRLSCNNAQGEYYLTDVFEFARAQNFSLITASPAFPWEAQGVNSREQLAELERIYQMRRAQSLMAGGVTLRDPARFDLRGQLNCGIDVEIDVNCVFEGEVTLGSEVTIGANCVIRNANIGDRVRVNENSVIEDSSVGAGAIIGPFARLRPGTNLASGVHVGNFVELKNATVAEASKINHLSYVGDSEIGKDVNIGAGTITCNYDGAYKHKTIIGDDVFVGSDCQFVAPVSVASGATIGAGSTITNDVNSDELAISRVRQRAIEGWVRPRKKKV